MLVQCVTHALTLKTARQTPPPGRPHREQHSDRTSVRNDLQATLSRTPRSLRSIRSAAADRYINLLDHMSHISWRTCVAHQSSDHNWPTTVRLRLMCDAVASLDARHLMDGGLRQGNFGVRPAIGYHERRQTWLDSLHSEVRKDQGQVVAVRLDGPFVEGTPEFTRPSLGIGRI